MTTVRLTTKWNSVDKRKKVASPFDWTHNFLFYIIIIIVIIITIIIIIIIVIIIIIIITIGLTPSKFQLGRVGLRCGKGAGAERLWSCPGQSGKITRVTLSVPDGFVGFLLCFSSASDSTDIFPLKKIFPWFDSIRLCQSLYGFSKSIRVQW